MTHTKINLYPYSQNGMSRQAWAVEMAEMIKGYIRGEPQFVEFDGLTDSRRTGSIGKILINPEDMQNLLYGDYDRTNWGYKPANRRPVIEVKEENVDAKKIENFYTNFHVTWDKRTNKVNLYNGYGASWLKGYDASQGTKWVWSKPNDPPATVPQDKLGRDISKGDFISYVLYHFDNSHNAAGIYYGKVTKIEGDGTVWAKNIKLSDTDKVAEKRIKDSSLIVIMSKDLMDKLMLARLSIL